MEGRWFESSYPDQILESTRESKCGVIGSRAGLRNLFPYGSESSSLSTWTRYIRAPMESVSRDDYLAGKRAQEALGTELGV